MNRTIALFVALVILLAHCLAIHTDGTGHIAFPYDQAYVALRLARNLIVDGQLSWNPGMPAWESHPSPVWIAVAALCERAAASRIGDQFDVSVNLLIQAASIVSALGAAVLAAQFRADRTAGLIAPLLVAASGSFAAAAPSGTEIPLFAMFATASFLFFERRYGNRLALAMMLACFTRPEGAFLAAALFVARFVGFERGARRPALWPFIAPALAVAATCYLRWKATGWVLPPTIHALFAPHEGQVAEGFAWLGNSLRTAISPILLVYAVVSLLRGRLSGTGRRSLLLAVVLALSVVLQGRSPLPFAVALVPTLPFVFVAVQEGMIEALDGTSVLARRLALSSLFACLLVTALVSRHPADLGPLPLESWHERWMRSRGSARYGYDQPLGRLGLEEEIAITIYQRGIGVFLRDSLDPGYSMLTPWPGSSAYLARLEVTDLLGRASPIAGKDRPASWERRERSDVVAALAMRPDYVIHEVRPGQRPPTIDDLAQSWLAELDDRAPTPERRAEIETALDAYELVTVPILLAMRGSAAPRNATFRILRRRDLDLRPRLELVRQGASFKVRLSHRSHLQIADLRVRAIDAAGRTWSLRPTGELASGDGAIARRALLLYHSGTRSIELMSGTLPEEIDGARLVELRAALRNPGSVGEDAFAQASGEVVAH